MSNILKISKINAGRQNFEHSKNRKRLYYYGMRYYAPWIARFISVDPLQFKYPFQNPYTYANNRPISMIDLDGAGGVVTIKGNKITIEAKLYVYREEGAEFSNDDIRKAIRNSNIPKHARITEKNGIFKINNYKRIKNTHESAKNKGFADNDIEYEVQYNYTVEIIDRKMAEKMQTGDMKYYTDEYDRHMSNFFEVKKELPVIAPGWGEPSGNIGSFDIDNLSIHTINHDLGHTIFGKNYWIPHHDFERYETHPPYKIPAGVTNNSETGEEEIVYREGVNSIMNGTDTLGVVDLEAILRAKGKTFFPVEGTWKLGNNNMKGGLVNKKKIIEGEKYK